MTDRATAAHGLISRETALLLIDVVTDFGFDVGKAIEFIKNIQGATLADSLKTVMLKRFAASLLYNVRIRKWSH